MKKKVWILITAVILVCLLSGCGCEHVWQEATCLNPRVCTECNETEGDPLGHAWQEADCENPMLCVRCGFTTGDPLGHEWREATCETDRACIRCALVEGEALGHDWIPATCDAPETCSRCELTRGEPLTHVLSDWSLSGETAKRACTACGMEEMQTSESYLTTWLPGMWRFVKAVDRNGVTQEAAPEMTEILTLKWEEGSKAVLTTGLGTFHGEMKYQGYQKADDSDMYGYHFVAEGGEISQFMYIRTETQENLYFMSMDDSLMEFERDAVETVAEESLPQETTEETVPETTGESKS